MNYQKILNEIQSELQSEVSEGQVASYIPELAKANPESFAINVHTIDGFDASVGQFETPFSLQSITKVYALTMAYNLFGEDLWKRVGVEPSGSAFNSLVQLEYENGKPRNPFINAGALVISDILCSAFENPKDELLKFVSRLVGKPVAFNLVVAQSEKDYGYRNASLVNLMKAYGNIENDVNTVLDFYFHLCSIELSVKDLSKSFMLFVTHGLVDDQRIITYSKAKRLNALMQTCGFYDEAGEFSFKVGLPGKSGVGGGIVAVHPEKYAIAVWSPRLNEKGNSYFGMKALEMFTTKSSLSIF
jgi:glutaminase